METKRATVILQADDYCVRTQKNCYECAFESECFSAREKSEAVKMAVQALQDKETRKYMVSFTGTSSIRFTMPDESIFNKTIIQLYEAVALQMGVDSSSVTFDCRKMLIAPNIQDAIYKAYELQCPDIFKEKPEDAKT